MVANAKDRCARRTPFECSLGVWRWLVAKLWTCAKCAKSAGAVPVVGLGRSVSVSVSFLGLVEGSGSSAKRCECIRFHWSRALFSDAIRSFLAHAARVDPDAFGARFNCFTAIAVVARQRTEQRRSGNDYVIMRRERVRAEAGSPSLGVLLCSSRGTEWMFVLTGSRSIFTERAAEPAAN